MLTYDVYVCQHMSAHVREYWDERFYFDSTWNRMCSFVKVINQFFPKTPSQEPWIFLFFHSQSHFRSQSQVLSVSVQSRVIWYPVLKLSLLSILFWPFGFFFSGWKIMFCPEEGSVRKREQRGTTSNQKKEGVSQYPQDRSSAQPERVCGVYIYSHKYRLLFSPLLFVWKWCASCLKMILEAG